MELNKIIELINKSREEYYVYGKSALSDSEYDALEETIRLLDPNHPILEKVGHKPSPLWKKAVHDIPMGSLNKCHTKEDFLKWANKFPMQLFEVQYKLDGLSVSLNYEDSKFIRGVSRGDGFEGEDLTPNIIQMKGFRSVLALGEFTGSVRAEILLNKSSFEAINSILPKDEQYSNPRNAAAGISRRLDGLYCKYLELYYYDISYSIDENEKINKIKNMALCSPHSQTLSIQGVLEFFDLIKKNRDELPICIDGIVIKVNSNKTQQQEGSVNNRPKAQIAWKFEPPYTQTSIKKVVWEIGRTGVLTPVAYYEPIEIAGTIVEKSSLHNAAEIKRLGIGINDVIILSKRGDIIPKCEAVIEHKGHPIEIPTICPCCGSTLTNNEVQLFCESPTCPAKELQRIMHFIKTIKIDEFGETMAEKLFTEGKLRSIADIFTLKKEDIAGIEGWGDKSAETIIGNINNQRVMAPEIFLAALGIPTLSTSTAEDLWAKFGSLDKVMAATVEDLCAIKGYSTISAIKIVEGLKECTALILTLLCYVEFEGQTKNGKLNGQSFCFTGNMSSPRTYYQDIVKKLGGINNSSVTKDLSFLVCNEDQGSNKSVKAKKYGVKIITEKEFLEKAGDIPNSEPDLKIKSNSFFE